MALWPQAYRRNYSQRDVMENKGVCRHQLWTWGSPYAYDVVDRNGIWNVLKNRE